MQGSIAVIISGESLNFDEISNHVKLNQTELIKKGQQITKNRSSLEDIWIYNISFLEEDFNTKIDEFLLNIIPYNDYFFRLSKTVEIELNLYINSEMGQFGFVLTKEQISIIQKMNLNINFHMLSYGLVEDN